jgi:hypothetical protein
MAAAWIKNKIISSAYSALRSVLNTARRITIRAKNESTASVTLDSTVQEIGVGRWELGPRLRMGFSDKNWVGIGLKWVRFHFLKKAKLVKSSMFTD